MRPQVEFTITATYEFTSGHPRRVQVPASDDNLTILELTSDIGKLRESFEGKLRFLHLPENCQLFHLGCRYRLYGYQADSPDLPHPSELFPGAISLTIL